MVRKTRMERAVERQRRWRKGLKMKKEEEEN